VSNRQDLQANAIEFLDNVLDVSLKPRIIPLVENYTLDTGKRLDRTPPDEFLPDRSGMKSLLEADDNWLKMCVLYLLGKTNDSDYLEIVHKLSSDPDRHVQEMANFALQSIREN